MKRMLSIILCVLLTFSFSSVITRPVNADETEQIPISQFVADNHVLMTRADGRLVGWGDNTYGQLGLGDTAQSSYTEPVEITFFADKGKIRQIAVIKDTSFVLLSNGELYSAGSGLYGKHGQGNTYNQIAWGRVGGELKFKKLYTNAAAEFAFAEDYSGSLYAWGKNADGQLGVGDTDARTSPTLVKESANIKQLWLGESYVMYIDLENQINYWGDNTNGQFGLDCSYYIASHSQYKYEGGTWKTEDPITTTKKKLEVPQRTTIARYNPDTLRPASETRPNVGEGRIAYWKTYTWDYITLLFTERANITNVKAGSNHSLMIYNDAVYGWGDASKKQLSTASQFGYPVTIDNVNTLIAAQKSKGENFKDLFVTGNSNYLTFDDGSVWVWGDNSYNKSGASGAPVNIDTPTKVTALQDVKITKVVAGRNTNYYITDTGDIYASGSNINGVTGLGEEYSDEATIDTPTKLGTIGYSETLTPPSADSVHIKVPEKAESGKTIEVEWNAVSNADRYELKRTVVLKSETEADDMMAKTEDVEVSTMAFIPKKNGMSEFLTFLSTTGNNEQTVYTGSQNTYTDTAGSNWKTVTYELKAVNRIGDYSDPVLSNAVSIVTADVGGGNDNNDGNDDNGGGNNNGGNNDSKVTVPPVNITVNPPAVTIQSPDISMRSPNVTVESPDISLNYPELQSSAGTTAGSATTGQVSGYYSWMPTPEQLARLGLSFGGNSSGAPYVITIEPSAPQYVQPTNSTTPTLLYVIIFVLLTVLIGGMMFVLASWLFNKNGTEIQRLRFMLSSVLTDADD